MRGEGVRLFLMPSRAGNDDDVDNDDDDNGDDYDDDYDYDNNSNKTLSTRR